MESRGTSKVKCDMMPYPVSAIIHHNIVKVNVLPMKSCAKPASVAGKYCMSKNYIRDIVQLYMGREDSAAISQPLTEWDKWRTAAFHHQSAL